MKHTAQIKKIEPAIARPAATQRNLTGRLLLPVLSGTHVIPFQEIRRLRSDNNYCIITLRDGQEIMASKTLKTVASDLPSATFLRAHQSHLVNKNAIRFLAADHLLLDNGDRIPCYVASWCTYVVIL